VGLPFLPSYDLREAGGALALLLCVLLVGICIHLAAKAMIKKDDFTRALSASALGILLAQFASDAVGGTYWIVGTLAAVLAFMLTIGVLYRAKAQGAVSVGAVTWVLWILSTMAVGYAQAHWHA